MSVLTEAYTLRNGTQIPQVGFGTWIDHDAFPACGIAGIEPRNIGVFGKRHRFDRFNP